MQHAAINTFSGLPARRAHPRPPLNSRALGTHDGSLLTKNTAGSKARPVGHLAEEGQKMS
jgi:hypothetical protein